MKLYELVREIDDIVHELESRVDPETGQIVDGAEIEERLTALEADFEGKADNIAGAIRNAQAEARACREEAARFTKRARAAERRASWLTDYLRDGMKSLGYKRLHTPRFRLSRRTGPPKVVVLTPGKVPEQYWIRQEPKLDKRGLLAAWKAGEEVPGTRIERGEALTIT